MHGRAVCCAPDATDRLNVVGQDCIARIWVSVSFFCHVSHQNEKMSHVVVVSREPNSSCDCCGLNQHYVRPAYTQWLRSHGVTQADFSLWWIH